jgi:hypothetical protein
MTQDIAYGQHSLASAVRELYEGEVMALFNDEDLLLSDCWYGQRHDTKKGRCSPRFTSGLRFENCKLSKIPLPLISSLLPSNKPLQSKTIVPEVSTGQNKQLELIDRQ